MPKERSDERGRAWRFVARFRRNQSEARIRLDPELTAGQQHLAAVAVEAARRGYVTHPSFPGVYVHGNENIQPGHFPTVFFRGEVVKGRVEFWRKEISLTDARKVAESVAAIDDLRAMANDYVHGEDDVQGDLLPYVKRIAQGRRAPGRGKR